MDWVKRHLGGWQNSLLHLSCCVHISTAPHTPFLTTGEVWLVCGWLRVALVANHHLRTLRAGSRTMSLCPSAPTAWLLVMEKAPSTVPGGQQVSNPYLFTWKQVEPLELLAQGGSTRKSETCDSTPGELPSVCELMRMASKEMDPWWAGGSFSFLRVQWFLVTQEGWVTWGCEPLQQP